MLDPLQRGDDCQTVNQHTTESEADNTPSSHLTRRDAVKHSIGLATGATVLSNLASDGAAAAKTGPGSGDGVNGLLTRGPATTTGEGAFSDSTAKVALNVSAPEQTEGNTVPVGIMWTCSLPQADLSWHEVSNLKIELEPLGNPTPNDVFAYTPYGPGGSDENLPPVLEVLGNLAWAVIDAPVNPFSIVPVDNSVDSGTYNNRKALSSEWPTFKQADTTAKTGGIRLATRLDSGGSPQNSEYKFVVKISGDVRYVSNSSGESKTGEFSTRQKISVDHV